MCVCVCVCSKSRALGATEHLADGTPHGSWLVMSDSGEEEVRLLCGVEVESEDDEELVLEGRFAIRGSKRVYCTVTRMIVFPSSRIEQFEQLCQRIASQRTCDDKRVVLNIRQNLRISRWDADRVCEQQG